MGIWDSLRRFSTRGTSSRGSLTKQRQRVGKSRLKERGLRLEQFEDRVLLSITNPGLDETYFVDGDGRGYYVDPPSDAGLPNGEEYTNAAGPAWYPFADTFSLHSNPGASKVIYLDFDGHTTTGTAWNTLWSIDPIVTPAYDFDGDVTTFSTAELQLIQDSWDLVSEDYLPFDVDVTTEDPGVEALRNTGGGDTEWGIRVVIGPDQANTGAGGMAYVGSFAWDSDTPAWVFNTSFKGLAEGVSHEVGHTLGLYHDGDSTQEYYPGYGSGPTGWAPIMGVGYYQELVQWSQGEYPDANNQEDDLNIIVTQNGFGYRADDHGSTVGTADPMNIAGDAISQSGIIELNTDADFFEFFTYPGPVTLDIDPFYISPNLDILATLYDESGTPIATSNPVGQLDARFNVNLDEGTYYLSVEGTGKPVTTDPGYSDYGSLGYYSISGSITSVPPIPPELVLVIPQEGGFVDRGSSLSIAPRELVLRFNEGQEFLDETTTPARDPNGWLSGGRGGIQVTRSVNGEWRDGDDEIIEIGWIGIGDRPNDVVLRFAETLPDDEYRISIIGSDNYVGPDGQPVAPLRNLEYTTFRYGQTVVDEHFEFELDLGAQVTAVVQQPVVVTEATISNGNTSVADGRTFTLSDGKTTTVFEFDRNSSVSAGNVAVNISSATSQTQFAKAIYDAIFDASVDGGGLLRLKGLYYGGSIVKVQLYDPNELGRRVELYGRNLPFTVTEKREQLTDTIEVYFNDDDLDPASATSAKFYQLIVTNNTATVDDDLLYDPDDGDTPVRKLQPVEIRYDAELDKAVLRFDKPLSDYGTGAFRLRIGDEYRKIQTASLLPQVQVISGSLEQHGENILETTSGGLTVDGTTFRISDGQFDATVEMDLQAVAVDVVSIPANGTVLTIDDGTGPVAIPLTISQPTVDLVAAQIRSQLVAHGYTVVADPIDPSRILIVDAISASSASAALDIFAAPFTLLEPADLGDMVEGEWVEVDKDGPGGSSVVRFQLRLPGGTTGLQPGSHQLVTIAGTGPGGSLAAGDVVRDLAAAMQNPTYGISALAVGSRLYFLNPNLTVNGAIPKVTIDDSVFSIMAPSVVSEVDDGEWLELNVGPEVLRFEFDRDGVYTPSTVQGTRTYRVDIGTAGADILTPLKTAIDDAIADLVAEGVLVSGAVTTQQVSSPARLIVRGIGNAKGGGVDPDMIVTHGYAAVVPNGVDDGEYVELFDAVTGTWTRFEFDNNAQISGAIAVPLTQVGATDAASLNAAVLARGFATARFDTVVYMFTSPTATLTGTVAGDVAALHLAIENPADPETGVLQYHGGMSTAEMTQLIADEIEARIAAKGLYLDVVAFSPYVAVTSVADAGSSFHTANELHNFGSQDGAQSLIVSAAIDPQVLLLEWPGAVDEPGQRDLQLHNLIYGEDHYMTGDSSPDSTDGIAEIHYNFADDYGIDPSTGVWLKNNITEAQKNLARQIFALYSEYLGVRFVETEFDGIQVVTGNLVVTGYLQSAPGGVAGVGGGNLALMDQAESWGANVFGGSWFNVAMHEIGHCLGYGHAYDLAAGAIMGSAEDSLSGINTEPVFPGAHDIVHGQHMYRPDSIDIDLYRFDLNEPGTLNAEVLSERLNDSSLLDSAITLYRLVEVRDADNNLKTTYELISRNDDYYSKDSFLELYLQPGTYFVGVSASGNNDYDPNIENTGVGGTSQGEYKLRLTFTPGGVDPDNPATFRGTGTNHLVDGTKTKFDGDADGVPGGAYNYWFNVEKDTVFVDKTSTSSVEDGTLANPYKTIDEAFRQKGTPGTIIRVLGNHFYDDDANNLSTYSDNVPYQIGVNPDTFQELADGRRMEVPQGVTVIFDAGAVVKLSGANVDVGSAAEQIDRSGGSLQVLGTPQNSVVFTSFRDASLGIDIDPSSKLPEKGDWGGLVFRNELDYDFIAAYDPSSGLAPREVLETQGIFLNYVNHADMRYGGGAVEVDGVKSVYAPIHMVEARPTVAHNRISLSADAALSADPNSFADTRFESWDAYAPFTARYNRVGPDVYGNYIVENSTNGMFVRISTAAGSAIKELEVPGRFDDWDIVHVIPENLFISGTPGGPVLQEATNPLVLLDENHLLAVPGSAIPDQDTFAIFDGATRVVFEFDLGANVAPGHIRIPYTLADSAEAVAASIRTAIEQARLQYGLCTGADLSETGSVVSLSHTGPSVQIEGFATYSARLDARLHIDPGMIVKMDGSRIEMEMGSQLIAEGRVGSDEGAPGYKVIFTSLLDDRYGAGGTFDTSSVTSGHVAEPGDWGGLYFWPTSSGSINHAIVAYAGGTTAIEGGFANFNAVEIRQAEVRIANSRFEHNGANAVTSDRNGRGASNAATIQIRGAQPVIVSNDFIDNAGAVVTVDLNSLVSESISDWGRTTGFIRDFEEYAGNRGPLVRGNRMTDNGINGMEVRGGILTTDSVWDDTDIVHVLYDEIDIPNFHHEGVLRLQSSDTESLVVKLLGANAGFTAGGDPLEIDDRIGGTLHVVGKPGHPVVFTSLRDDSVGAGFTLGNLPQNDTNNDGSATSASPGDWRSLLIDTYSNDRNVAVVTETELPYGSASDTNGVPNNAQVIGSLATEDKAGDDNLRLGFEVHGTIRTDAPTDADVYTFNAYAGTEIWIDIDRSNYALDLVVELITADGTVLARSDNSYFEELAGSVEDLSAESHTMDRDNWLRHDFYTVNERDPGLRLVLPGPAGQVRTYYVRVRSVLAIGAIPAADEIYSAGSFTTGRRFTIADPYKSFMFEFTANGSVTNPAYIPVVLPSGADASDPAKMADAIVAAVAVARSRGLLATARVLDGKVVLDGAHVRFNGLDTSLTHLANTSGEYQLQIRLEEMQEIPGSTIQYADIRYAVNGIEVYGQPGHSPLLGESAEVEQGSQNPNNTVDQAQQIGNLLQVDRNAISVAGYLEGRTDVDWYAMSVDLGGIQSIAGVTNLGSVWATIFDIDYADQMTRPDLNLWVFDSNRNLILAGGSSNIADDRPEPIPNATIEDLSRGSVGARDPFIGSALLLEGDGNRGVYYIAVTSTLAVPSELDPVLSPLTRREPLSSVNRIATEHFDELPYNRDNTTDPDFTGVRLDPIPYEFTLSDTILYVSVGETLYTVNPFTGAFQTEVTSMNPNTFLPGVGDRLFYDDIDMRNDGRLFTIQSGQTGNGMGLQEPDTLMLSTENARNVLQQNDTGITFYRRDPNNANALQRDPNGGIQFEAIVHDHDNTRRNIYAVGTADDSLPELAYENLMYVLNPAGEAYTHPNILNGSRASGAREYSGEKIPLGRLYTAPTIVVGPATQSSPAYTSASAGGTYYTDMDIEDGEWFTVTDGSTTARFEFDLGREYFLDPGGASKIFDGHYFTVTSLGAAQPTSFEFNSGPVLRRTGTFANGDTFQISGYVNPNGGGTIVTETFELHVTGTPASTSGYNVIEVASISSAVVMPAIVTAINANANFAVTASLNDDGTRISLQNDSRTTAPTVLLGTGLAVSGDYLRSVPNSILIEYDETNTGTDLGASIVAALAPYVIEAGYGERFGTAAELGSNGDRLSIRGADAVDMSHTPAFRYEAASDDGRTAGSVPVYIHAGMNETQVAVRMANAIRFGSVEYDGFTPIPTGLVGVTATASGDSVILGGSVNNSSAVNPGDLNEPLSAKGEGGGGRITGLAYVGSTMYAVSDNGDLFRVSNEHNDPASAGTYAYQPVDPSGTYNRVSHNPNAGPQLHFIANIKYGGSSIVFSGLTDGPSNAQGGKFAQTVFATDVLGHLYALDLNGNLLPIFNDGAERVQLDSGVNSSDDMGLSLLSQYNVDGTGGNARRAVTGLAFSPIDFNLWHMTRNREHDAGHGVNQTHDGVRNGELRYGPADNWTEGDLSMYFGLEDPSNTATAWDQPIGENFERGPASANINTSAYLTYDLPGGAHGTFTTTTFSLDGYSEQDKPTLYFNYFAETGGSNDWDGLRVYVSNDGAKWDLVATNTDTDDGTRRLYGLHQEMQTPTVPTRVVDEILDTGDAWRQARVDLSRYAGQDNLRLRFDFSTASDMDIGDLTHGTTQGNQHHYMSPVPAYEIADGDTFTLYNGTSYGTAQTFEFDLGLALGLPNVAGAAIGDGEWFSVNDGVGGVVEFEFDKNGVVGAGRVPITIANSMSTAEVIAAMIGAIDPALDVEGLAPNPAKDPNRLFLARAVAVETAFAPTLTVLGDAPGTVAAGNIRVPIRGDMDRLEVAEMVTQVVNQQLVRQRDTNAGAVVGGSSEVIRVTSASFTSFTLRGVTYRGELRTVRFVADGFSTLPTVVGPDTVRVGTSGVTSSSHLAQRIAAAINAANTGGPSSSQPELMIQATATTRTTGGGTIDVVEFNLANTPVTLVNGTSQLPLWNADNAIIHWDQGVGELLNLVGYSMLDNGPLGYSGSGGWNGNIFGELEGDDPNRKNDFGGSRASDNRYNLFERGQNNNFEGFYIDDIIVGFAERGELVTDAYRDGTLTDFSFAPLPDGNLYPEDPIVTEGSYQLEVRTGANYAFYAGAAAYPVTYVTESWDTNDRMADDFTLIVPAANELHHGQWFELSDGRDDVALRFVFVDTVVGGGSGSGYVRIDFNAGDSADTMALRVAAAVNQAKIDGKIDISAQAIVNSNRVDLFDAVRMANDPSATSPVTADFYPTTGGDTTYDKGDSNRERDKGQITITGNSVTYSQNTGIVVAPSRDTAADWAHPASGRTLNDPNQLVPGIMIENNLVAYSGQIGIDFRGAATDTGLPIGAVPFGRIVNNTIYGGQGIGIGIDVGPNASPTLLNNIVASLNTGIRIDTSSVNAGTVVGGSLYQSNATNLQGAVTESFGVYLNPGDPLFVDAAGGNFYLDHGSLAIDSSIDSLEERQAYFNAILEPVGIPVSPILAPEVDMFGQLRRDDPSVNSPSGLGKNVFKDRGAIDRVDFVEPMSSVSVPLDNGPDDKLGLIANDVKIVGKKSLKFQIQLKDSGGVGIDDASVVTSAIHLYRDLDEATYLNPLTRDPELVEGIDYKMVYNATNDTIDLIPLAGLWAEGYDYTIVLDQTIRDRANNALQPNRYSGTFNGLTVFQISLAGLDFGDAPDSYKTALDSDGPRHVIYGGFHLGAGVDSETDANPSANADADLFDDGISLSGSGLLAGHQATVTITASLQNPNLTSLYGSSAYVYFWIDFDNDGVFEDNQYEAFQKIVVDGVNTIDIDVPDEIDGNPVSGEVKARFRLGYVKNEVNVPYGQASDGEVEDYVFEVVESLRDFGDAPNDATHSYPVVQSLGGAWHTVKSPTVNATTVFLGAVPPDSELNGVPSSAAMGDDLRGTDDEDGVDVKNVVFVADGVTGNNMPVTVTSTTAQDVYLNAWFDKNADGDWDDAGEQIAQGMPFHFDTAGSLTKDVEFTIPALAGQQAVSYVRLRVSHEQNLGVRNQYDAVNDVWLPVQDGEVEDHQVFVVNQARDYGDAPDNIIGLRDYPTLLASNGAYHAVHSGIYLGQKVDAEYDGQPNAAATGDDLAFPGTAGDDEDGVTFDAFNRFVPGGVAVVDVDVHNTLGQQAYLHGWIDFNHDGDWNDPGEQVFGGAGSGLAVQPGSNVLTINVPNLYDPGDPTAISVLGDTYARFRLSTDPNLSYTGGAGNGEVEDYRVTIEIGDATIQGKKFDDRDADGVYESSVQGTIPPIELATVGLGPTVLVNTDNNWTDALPMGFNFEFFGRTYNSLYVSPNGLVSFQDPEPLFGPAYAATTPGFPAPLPIIAPFWADADLTQSGGSVHMSYGVSQRGTPFVQIDWNNVGYYDRSSPSNLPLRNTFSLYLEDAPAGDIVAFVYDTMQWTTGDLQGSGGFGGPGAEIGFDAGDGTRYYSEMRPNSSQGLSDLLASAEDDVFGYRMDPTTGLLVEGEPGLPGVVVYLDYNNDGIRNATEPWTVTRQDDLNTPGIDETGDFEFTGLFSGTYIVREELSEGWIQTYPSNQLGYLPDVNGNKIRTVGGTDIADGDAFLIGDGTVTLRFEFEESNLLDGTSPGSIPVLFNAAMSAADVADAIAAAVNAQSMDLAATPSGDLVILDADTAANPSAAVSIDPQDTLLVVLGSSAIAESEHPVTHEMERYYIVEVGSGETFTGALFGNHLLATITMGDSSVAEGNAGETMVNVVFERRGAFGAPVRVHYHTEDGTAKHQNDEYGLSDYQQTSSSFVFYPQDTPQATWSTQAITHNQTNDYDYHVSRDTIVFEVADGNDWEILIYNHAIGGAPVALTDNLTDDRFAALHRMYPSNPADPGKIYAVWAGVDPAPGQTDYEIFFTEITVTLPNGTDPGGLEVGPTIQLTQNTTDDKSPRVSESFITWWGFDAAGDTDVYMHEIATVGTADAKVHNISNNDYNDYDPTIDGNRIAWHSEVGQGTDVFLWNGADWNGTSPPAGQTRRVTNNQASNSAPQLYGNYLIWQGREGMDFDVFLYEIDSLTTAQISVDSYDDVMPQIYGDNVVWQGGPSSNREIFIYNIADGGTPSNVSNNSGLDERPQIDGDQIVWHSFDGNDWEVMFFDLTQPFLPLNVSNNLDYDWGPQISDDLLVWRSNDGVDYEIVVASQNDPVATQTVQLVVYGDIEKEDDQYFKVVIDSVTIEGSTLTIDPGDMIGLVDGGTIWIYNDDGQLDFGDAPASYHTLIADNGPRHMTAPGGDNEGYYLGAKIDAEPDGRPSAGADGDDGFTSDDEDGVSIRSHWLPGGIVQLVVTASKDGYFKGWVDYNGDGDFGNGNGATDRNERLKFTMGGTSSENIRLVQGENTLTVQVPDDADLGPSFARFRFTKDELPNLSYVGSAWSGEVEDYAINITSDQPGVKITPSNGTNTAIEGGVGDTYQVVLTAKPTQTVWVNIAGDANVTTIPPQLKFTVDNWNVVQTVTIAAVDDSIAESAADNVGVITHTTDSLDLAYKGLVIDPVLVSITDNDLAKVQVLRTGGSTRVNEDGSLTDTYELMLTSQPVGNVTVSVDAGSQLRVSKTAGGTATQTLDFVFTPANWNVRQVVYVTAVDDHVAEGNPELPLGSREHSAYITHMVSSRSGSTILDPMYDALGGSVDSVVVQIGDNDSPGIEVDIPGGSLTVSEDGATSGTYRIRLRSQPTSAVSVAFLPDAQLGSTTPGPLVFDAGNWNVYRTVTLRAVDDSVAEGTHSGQVTHVVTSADPFYADLIAEPVTAAILDNDTAGIVIDDGGSLDVAEGGQSDTYQVQLSSQPTADVTVTVVRGSQLQSNVESLLFTPANWNQPQTVTISAVDDAVAEGNHAAAVGHTVKSADLNYHNLQVPVRTVNIADNDSAGVAISAAGTVLNLAEGGAAAQYEIVLTSQPTSRVVVTLEGGDQIDVIPTEITFDAADWNQPRVISVRAVNDSVDEGDHSATIAHTVSSSDVNYNTLTLDSVAVDISDDDTAGIVITETVGATAVSEAGVTDIYTVKLQSQPVASVTIQLVPDGQLKVYPSSLTFTAQNWNQPQTVAVSAVNDAIAEGEHTGKISHLVNSTDAKYAGLTPPDLIVNITDDDTAALIVTETGGGSAVTEGGATDTYTVALGAQPTANVVVTVTSGGEVSVSPTQLTFTPTNWNLPQTVTITAVDDLDDEITEFAEITHVLASADPKYNGAAAPSVFVEVTDNDEPGSGTLNLVGTAGNDTLELVRGDVLTVRLNGELKYQGTQVHTVTFDGLAGVDKIDVTGSAEFEQASVNPNNVTFTGTNFSFSAANIEQSVLQGGGGNDFLQVVDSPGDDAVTGSPTQVSLVGAGFSHQANGFFESQLYARNGGYDTLSLTDSAGKDKAKVEEGDIVKLYSPTYYTRGKFFEETLITSTGGKDTLVAWDTHADDTVTASYNEIVIQTGTNLSNPGTLRQKATIRGFEYSTLYARAGGHDTLNLLDSPADDKAVLLAYKAQMYPRNDKGPYDYKITGRSFDVVHAQATTGYDVVRMNDSAEVDLLTAAYVEGKTWASLEKPANGTAMALMYDATGFDLVRAVNEHYHYGGPKNQKDVDTAVDFLMLDDDALWEDI